MAFNMHLMSSKYGSENDLRQIKKFVCLRSAYSLSVLNMDWKHESRKVIK